MGKMFIVIFSSCCLLIRFSLNKKIKVEIGYKNLIKNYEHYGDIIWFKAGTYVIATASIANTVTGSNINI